MVSYALGERNQTSVIKIVSLILVLATLIVSLPLSAFAKSGKNIVDYVDASELAEITK